jgi:hypothetical protein
VAPLLTGVGSHRLLAIAPTSGGHSQTATVLIIVGGFVVVGIIAFILRVGRGGD